MDAAINYVLRDSSALASTVDRNKTEMTASGFDNAVYTQLVSKAEELASKETIQERAVGDVRDKTGTQNELVVNVQKLLSDIKFAAKSAYGKDKRMLGLFKVGETVSKSVKALIPSCNYMIEQVNATKADLLKNGLTQAKIDALVAAPAELEVADAAQESAKIIQKSRTLERDAAKKELKEIMFKIRSFAKVCFSDKQEILLQFDPIPKGRGGAGEEETPATPAAPDK